MTKYLYMREPIRDKARLQHILDAIEKVLEYTKDIHNVEELDADSLRKHATTYNIQIIGEAIYKLTPEFKATHPQTPWKMIEKSRHILVHDYYQVEIRILWSIIHEDMIPLRNQVQEYLKEFQ